MPSTSGRPHTLSRRSVRPPTLSAARLPWCIPRDTKVPCASASPWGYWTFGVWNSISILEKNGSLVQVDLTPADFVPSTRTVRPSHSTHHLSTSHVSYDVTSTSNHLTIAFVEFGIRFRFWRNEVALLLERPNTRGLGTSTRTMRLSCERSPSSYPERTTAGTDSSLMHLVLLCQCIVRLQSHSSALQSYMPTITAARVLVVADEHDYGDLRIHSRLDMEDRTGR